MRKIETRPNLSGPVPRALAAMVVAAGLVSCKAVGPDYRRPALDVPGAYKSATTRPVTVAGLTGDWWIVFNDPNLTRLEEAARESNQDLKAAAARVLQARASARIVRGQFFPTVTFGPSIQRSRGGARGGGSTSTTNPSGNGTTGRSGVGGGGSNSGNTSTSVGIPFDLSYEIDVWGRIRRAYESAQDQARASLFDYQVVLLTLQADVAQDYFTIRSLDDQSRILVRSVDSYRRQVFLTEEEFRAGRVGQIDVLQARTQLNTTIAQEIEVRRQRADVEHALAILTGRTPGELSVAIQPLEASPPVIPPGLPAEILRRRPDVAEAEANLAAANAEIGVAKAAFYPTIRLTGLAGFESSDLQHALDWQSRVWSLGPSLSLPLFDGGRIRANYQQAQARYDELLANYRTQILNALRDVEDALTDLHLRADIAQAQAEAVKSAREYLRLSELQRRAGSLTYFQVIDAERTLLNAELSAAQTLNQRMGSTVLLVKALGGGWDAEAPAATQVAIPAAVQPDR